MAFRSSGPEVFCKKCVFKNFAKLTGKQLRSATLLKKILWHRCFLVNFSKFLRTLFFHRTPPVAASGPSQQVQYIIKVLRITLLRTDSHNYSHNSCLINSSHMFSHHKVSQWYCGNGIVKGKHFTSDILFISSVLCYRKITVPFKKHKNKKETPLKRDSGKGDFLWNLKKAWQHLF